MDDGERMLEVGRLDTYVRRYVHKFYACAGKCLLEPWECNLLYLPYPTLPSWLSQYQ
jgi:hypothetical protein